MPKVRFLKDYTVKDKEGATYKAGKVYELETDESVNHFVSRRVAEPAPDSAKAEEPTYAGEPPVKREADSSTTRRVETRTPPQAPDVVKHPDEYTVEAIKEEISTMDDPKQLRALLKDERKGVNEAAQKRLDELSKK